MPASSHQASWRLSSTTSFSDIGNHTEVSLSSHTAMGSIDLTVNPWNNTNDETRRKRRNGKNRFRQHVNPLARRYQQPAILPSDWPGDVLTDLSLPLHVDVGCGKGGFLLEIAAKKPDFNYLGLEIRPSVFQFALDRVKKRGLSGRLIFVGCNANVDLERLLTIYQEAGGRVGTVSIQFPDPHFKAAHAKRRVVTPRLVRTLAKILPENAIVFLQSDVQNVLDDMRLRFRDSPLYFQDDIDSPDDYMQNNPLGIETEREISVLKQDLPVYRALLRRTATLFDPNE